MNNSHQAWVLQRFKRVFIQQSKSKNFFMSAAKIHEREKMHAADSHSPQQ
jgi:hypothetical protein